MYLSDFISLDSYRILALRRTHEEALTIPVRHYSVFSAVLKM